MTKSEAHNIETHHLKPLFEPLIHVIFLWYFYMLLLTYWTF